MKEKGDFERDNGALLQWCKANHPELVRVKEEPDWNAVKAYIKGGNQRAAGGRNADPKSHRNLR